MAYALRHPDGRKLWYDKRVIRYYAAKEPASSRSVELTWQDEREAEEASEYYGAGEQGFVIVEVKK